MANHRISASPPTGSLRSSEEPTMTAIARIHPNDEHDPFTAKMVTGQGVKGKPNGSITYEDLVSEATRLTDDGKRLDWPCVVKNEAEWFMPSTLPSRSSTEQVKRGTFVALVVDIDGGGPTFADVEYAVLTAAGGAVAFIYSTKSATAEAPRWRVVIPLERPLPGADYADTAKALYNKIREASDGAVDPDDAVARPSQISFCPNAPDCNQNEDDYLAFAAEIGDDPNRALDLTDDHPIVQLREKRRREAQREADAAAEQAKNRRRGGTTLIDRFNAQHRLEDLLRRYNYEQASDPSGQWPTNDWRSPYQTSGSFATRVFSDGGDQRWVSLSGSDAKRGIGAQSNSKASRFGDAFDLYLHFEHGGDMGAALEAWKAQCDENRHVDVARALVNRDAETTELHTRLRELGRRKTEGTRR